MFAPLYILLIIVPKFWKLPDFHVYFREVVTRDAHSDGELSDDEDNMRLRKGSVANLRKLKIW